MNKEQLGWNPRLEALYNQIAEANNQAARVTRVDRGSLILATENGQQRAEYSHQPKLEMPAPGDWVVMEQCSDQAVIRHILPRSGVLSRLRPGRGLQPQVVAANIDKVLIVEGLDRGPNLRRIERAVALTWDGGAQPVVVLTKTDLCADVDAAIQAAEAAAPMVEVVAVTAILDQGIERLNTLLPAGSTAVVLGPSGAGKSTLINRLLGSEDILTGEVRHMDRRGRHTTTSRELYVLPSGGLVIDTPGVRELGLWLDADAVEAAFPEIEEIAAGCRYRDCRHDNEPGCAVRAAEEEGHLNPGRRESYLKLRLEAESLERRRDPALSREAKARDRALAKLIRTTTNRKNGKH